MSVTRECVQSMSVTTEHVTSKRVLSTRSFFRRRRRNVGLLNATACRSVTGQVASCSSVYLSAAVSEDGCVAVLEDFLQKPAQSVVAYFKCFLIILSKENSFSPP